MIELRPATSEDLPAVHRVWWAADPLEAGNDNPWFRHVLRTGSMMAAMFEGRVIGFAGVRRVGETCVVSDCFVDPDHQAQGVGSRLLSELAPPGRPVMTLASSDPKARSLYSRLGMVPQWKCQYLQGDPTRVERALTPVLEVDRYPVAESDRPHLTEDLQCRFLEAGKGCAAVGVDSIESSLVPLPSGPIESLTAVLGWMADRGDHQVNLHLSERHPVFPLLIDAGFTVTGADTLMASAGAEVPDPTRMTFNGDILRLLW